MRYKMKRLCSLLLVFALCIQSLVGCGSDTDKRSSSNVYVEESVIKEQTIAESTIDEKYLDETYITENLIYEDGIYEYTIDENVISEAYIIEVTISEDVEEEILAQLPDDFSEYEIDWAAVIGKFAVGTTIIIATGIVQHYLHSTYFLFASPIKVTRDALIGGSMEAAIRVALETDKTGNNAEAAIKKYAIEGFADGYMWGAVTSVLSVMHKNFKLPKSLAMSSGKVGKIALDGTVLDEAGNELGKAYIGKKGIYVLKETATSTKIELFDVAGKQIVNATAEQMAQIAKGTLPPNSIFRLGTGDTAKICRTDAAGIVYRINDELVPNITYKLGTVVYQTDDYGRIVKVTFDELTLKDADRPRKVIQNTLSEIGRGYEKVNDDRGHIIADRFNGNNSLANIVSMDSDLNRGEYKAMEDIWAESIKLGKNVSGTIELKYSGKSYRPDVLDVWYDIGEGSIEKVFSNL